MHTNMQNLYKKMDPWIINVYGSGAYHFCRRIKIGVIKSTEKGLIVFQNTILIPVNHKIA
jgi:hypothetical protein